MMMARKENAVVRAAKAVVKPLKDASKRLDEIVEQEAPRPKPNEGRKADTSMPSTPMGIGCPIVVTKLAALLGGVVFAVALLAGCKPVEGKPSPAPVASCEEDQPCWDCKTMGNRQCGEGDVRR